MSEAKLRQYIKSSKDRDTGLPFVLVYGPKLSGKTELLRLVPGLAKTCFPKARLACVSVDLRSVPWVNPSEPLQQLAEMLVKAAWESEEQLRIEADPRDFRTALTDIRQESARKHYWGVLVTIDHLDFLPNEGIRALCRELKMMKDEGQEMMRRIGVIAASARNLAWLRDQEASPFLAFDRIMLPAPEASDAHDPLIQAILQETGLALGTDLTRDDLDRIVNWAIHKKHNIRALRETLLHVVTDSDLADLTRAVEPSSCSPILRSTTPAFDPYEETGIVIACQNGNHQFRHKVMAALYSATDAVWSATEPQPDAADGSLASVIHSIAAYRARLRNSRDIGAFLLELRHLWTLVIEQKEVPDFFLLLEGAHPNDPSWITYTGNRGELRWIRTRDIPGAITAALKTGRGHRFATVLTDETTAVCWSSYEGSYGVMRLFARVPRRGSYSFNETSLRHWTNLMKHVWEMLCFLTTHEYGAQHLRENNELNIDRSSVFVVHGHDVRAFEEIHARLKEHKLKAITWEDAKRFTHKASPTNLETVQAGLEHAYAIAILMTGDDVGKLNGTQRKTSHAEAYSPQPRQNVLIEAGMAMAMNPNRTILVHFESIRQASDFAGLNVVEYDYSQQARDKLESALVRAGCITENRKKAPNRGLKSRGSRPKPSLQP